MEQLTAIAVLTTFFVSSGAQRLNMRTRAAQRGGTVEDVLTRETRAAQLPTLVDESETGGAQQHDTAQ
jgi:hypothetical protein